MTATIAIQIRDALATAIEGITTDNGFDANIAIASGNVLTGNFVSPFDKRQFPYVHVGHITTDYRGTNTASGEQLPNVTIQILGFVKDTADAEAVADSLGQAIIARITLDPTLGGLAIDTLYNQIETSETTETGLAVVQIEVNVLMIHDYGSSGG